MPQMAPLSWLTLMISFIIMFLMFNVTNYYSFLYKNNKDNKVYIKTFKINWKW